LSSINIKLRHVHNLAQFFYKILIISTLFILIKNNIISNLKKAIRDEYADLGVDAYYRSHANVYENPHYPYIKSLLTQNQHRIDYTRVMDLSAGGGEVTEILRGLLNLDAQEAKKRFLGTDPFTFRLYEKNTGIRCLPINFEQIIKGKLTPINAGSVSEPFSCIICSFAMHLCEEKMLYPLVNQLFMHAKNIIIITPHKRPALEDLTNVVLDFEDFVLTERGKKVFLKSYTNGFETL
jgi:hypothetical protein